MALIKDVLELDIFNFEQEYMVKYLYGLYKISMEISHLKEGAMLEFEFVAYQTNLTT
jgi:hypothetical protein